MRSVLAACVVLLVCLSISVPGVAQLTPPYQWRVMQTEHFRVIFHPEVAGLAAEAAVAAEDAYNLWAAELDTTPPPMTDIVVIDFDDSPNGFADSYNLTSWEFVSQIQFGTFFGGRVPSNMGDTVYHEMWHIVDINHVDGLSAGLRKVFGRTIMPNDAKPWFAIEGSATYSEDLVYGYSRASAALSRMYLQQLALDNDFPDLDRAAHRFSNLTWPTSGTMAYIMGAWFLRYVEETYGRGTLAKIDDITANDLFATLSNLLEPIMSEHLGVGVYIGPDFGQTLTKATGVDWRELYVGFQNWMRDQAVNQLDRVASQGGETVSLKLTDYGHWTTQPKWSPSGEWIAYEHSSPFRRGGLRLVRPDGTDDHALISNVMIFDHAFNWSPDGKQIVYSNYDQYGQYVNVNDLFAYDLESNATTRLTHGVRAHSPVFTPDGGAIIYAENQGGDLSPRIMKLDIASGERTLIHEFEHDTFTDFLAISPDGRQLALTLWKRPGFTDLYLLDLSTHELTPVTQDPEEDFRPVWSADGAYVVFDSIRDETFNLHAYHVESGKLYRITNVVSGALSPTVDPAGGHIAYAGYSGAGYDIHRIPFDPSQWTAVNYPQQTLPAWDDYPTLDYEVQAYNPYVTMLPKYWQPVLRETQAGVSTDAWDALYRQYYSIEAGYDWDVGAPFGSLFYLNEEHLSPLSVSLFAGVFPGAGDVEVLSLSVSPIDQFFRANTLTLELERSNFGGEAHAVHGTLDYYERFGKDLSWMDLNVSLSGSLNHVMEGDAFSLDTVLDVRKTFHLPVIDPKGAHQLATKTTIGWGDYEGAFGIGGTRGALMVRGQPGGVAVGAFAVAGSLEYRFPVLSVEKGLSLFPIFLDDIRLALFVDAGAAAESVEALQDNLVWGGGAEIAVQYVHGYFLQRQIVFGAAYGNGQPQPEFYMSFGVSF